MGFRGNAVRRVTLTSLLTILLTCVNIFARDKSSEIDHLIQQYHDYRRFNGAVLVSEAGRVIFEKGYGFANMEWSIPNRPDTKFRLGSITKQFTAMLVMQQVEEGNINLYATISEYLPDYRKDIGDIVTIHQLLTHTSGIPSYTNLPNFGEISRNPYSVGEFVAQYCSGDLEFEPGSQFSYSNSGYFILGFILETITGKSYERLLNDGILAPAGMNNTGYDHQETVLAKRAGGYIPTAFGYINAAYSDMSVPYAAGAMYSTVRDLYLWDQTLSSPELLSEEYRDIMFTVHQDNYAYGWWREMLPLFGSQDSVDVVWHVGGIRGFYNLITRELKSKNLIVLLNNTAKYNVSDLRNLTIGILNILHEMPYDLPEMTGIESLIETLQNTGASAAIYQYRELKDDSTDSYEFHEFELNWLGFQLLHQGLVDEAVALFELVVDEYPHSYNAYDSLADALQNKGEIESAIMNYKKALQLNPDYQEAAKKLKALGQ